MNHSKRQLVGITIWWAEGTKSRRDKRWKTAASFPIEVTNTDPNVIQLFLLFLRHDIQIDEKKLRVQIQIHEGDNQIELEKFWSDITGVSKIYFHQTIVRPIGNKPGKTKGTCKVRFSDKATYLQLEALWRDVVAGVAGSIA